MSDCMVLWLVLEQYYMMVIMVATILSPDLMASGFGSWWRMGSGECVGSCIANEARLWL